MKKLLKHLFTIVAICIAFTAYAQTFKEIKKESHVIVKGTSSMHDWEMDMKEYTCVINIEKNGTSIAINKASFSGESESLTSGNSIMDNKTHDALKSEQHPKLSFKIDQSYIIETVEENFNGTVNGTLQLAGVSKNVSIAFSGKKITDDIIQISGSKALRMSDFNIDPPTAMFGALKTGNEIQIEFLITLKSNS